MSEDTMPFTTSTNSSYQPPVGGANYDQQALAALVEKLVADRMSSLGVEAPKPEPTPEEAARKAIDNRGVGLGVEERMAEMYRLFHTLAQKVGI